MTTQGYFDSAIPPDLNLNVAGLKVLLLVRTERDSTPLLAALKPVDGIDVQVLKRSAWPLTNVAGGAQSVDVVLVDSDFGDQGDLSFIRQLKLSNDATEYRIVVLADRGSGAGALQAFRAGADDVLLKPIDLGEAREVFSRLAAVPRGDGGGSSGNIIVFMHVTGGAGATTCAVNAAYALAESGAPRGCCLIDMDLQFGSAANLLDMACSTSMQELMTDPGRLDRLMLESILVRHPTGLQVLTAPRMPVPLSALRSSTVSELLRLAKGRFAHVVVDLPVALAPWTDVVLRMATQIYLVTPMTVPAAHRLTRILSLMRQQDLGHLPIKIVVNRGDSAGKGGAIAPSQFTKAISRPIDHVVPNDYGLVLQSHNQGTPAAGLKPQGRFVQAIKEMLAEDMGASPFAQSSRKFALFGRL